MSGALSLVQNYCRVLLQCLYILDPNTTKFQNVDEAPHYYAEAFPVFISLIVLERLLLWLGGKRLPRVNDGLTSMACAIFNEVGRIFFNGAETFLYIYVYNNYRIYELPWDSTVTWIMAAIAVDFFFYWVHRAAHEVNLIWSQHQVHHSSEEFNLTTGFRESLFEGWFGSVFYLPMAFFIPPSVFVVHLEFNFMYQFWIHTELIDHLGPLEFIFNTPSHHRVHHAANKYCIDKNYGGYLIIWDRLFGTFAQEKKDQKLAYGLVEPVRSFNPLYLEVFYIGHIIEKMRSLNGLANKLSAVFKGPGWSPGSPRTGDLSLLPEITERVKFQKPISNLMQTFETIHFILLAAGFHLLSHSQTNAVIQWILGLYILLSLTSIGLVYDNSSWAPLTEFLRSSTFLLFSLIQPAFLEDEIPRFYLFLVKLFYGFSALYWLANVTKENKPKNKSSRQRSDRKVSRTIG